MRLLLIVLLMPLLSHAQLYQCKQNGKTTIQDTPCQPAAQVVKTYDTTQPRAPQASSNSQTCKYIQQRMDTIEINQNYTKAQKHNLKIDARKEYDNAGCSVFPMHEGWYESGKIKQQNNPVLIEATTKQKTLSGGRQIVPPTRQPKKQW